jgi:hypothetical protein
MYGYAVLCTALTSLAAPDTSKIETVGSSFMMGYAQGCTDLAALALPDTSSMTSVGNYFMPYYAYDCTALVALVAPIAPGYFVSTVTDLFYSVYYNESTDFNGSLKLYTTQAHKAAWAALTESGEFLHTNQIQNADKVVVVDVVVADPASKTFSGTQKVTLSTTTDGADIYYTLDGSNPSDTANVNRLKYNGEITLSATTTLKAVAVKENWADSGVLTETYTLYTNPDDGGGLPTGAIVTIVLGAIAVLGGGFCVYWFVIRKRKKA